MIFVGEVVLWASACASTVAALASILPEYEKMIYSTATLSVPNTKNEYFEARDVDIAFGSALEDSREDDFRSKALGYTNIQSFFVPDMSLQSIPFLKFSDRSAFAIVFTSIAVFATLVFLYKCSKLMRVFKGEATRRLGDMEGCVCFYNT